MVITNFWSIVLDDQLIIDLKRSIDLRWLLMSSAIFLSDDLILLFAVGDAAPGPSRWSRAVGGSWSSFGGLPALSFPRMDLWLGRERVTQRRVMLLQGAVHHHVHVVETQSVKPSEKTTLPRTKKGPINLRSHPLFIVQHAFRFCWCFRNHPLFLVERSNMLDCGDILLNCGTGVERFTKELSPSPWALHLREHKKIFTSCEIPTVPLWLVIWVLHSSIFVFMFLLVVPLLLRTTVVFRLQILHTFSALLFKENFLLTFFFFPSYIPWHF